MTAVTARHIDPPLVLLAMDWADGEAGRISGFRHRRTPGFTNLATGAVP
jgi:hypothetical protein